MYAIRSYYDPYMNKKANNKNLVKVGRITAIISLIVACFIAPSLGNIGQAFQYIQEYTGIVTPGVITSYSIHYTKLYEKNNNQQKLLRQSPAFFH